MSESKRSLTFCAHTHTHTTLSASPQWKIGNAAWLHEPKKNKHKTKWIERSEMFFGFKAKRQFVYRSQSRNIRQTNADGLFLWNSQSAKGNEDDDGDNNMCQTLIVRYDVFEQRKGSERARERERKRKYLLDHLHKQFFFLLLLLIKNYYYICY